MSAGNTRVESTASRGFPSRLVVCLLSFLLLFLLSAATALAAASWAAQADKQVKDWQKQLAHWVQQPPSLEQIDRRSAEVFELRQRADTCVADFAAPLAAIDAKLAALGEQREDESDEVRRLRRETQREKEQVESQAALCRVVALAARDLQAELKILRTDTVTSALGQRESEVWNALQAILGGEDYLAEGAARPFVWWPSAVAGVAVLLLLYPLGGYLARLLRRHYPEPEPPASWRVSVLFAHMLARRLPWIALLVSLATVAYLGNAPLIGAVLMALLLSLVLAPIIEMLLCQSVYRCVGGLPMRILLDLALIGLALRLGHLEAVLTPEALLAGYAGYMLLVMVTSLWLLFALASRDDLRMLRGLRLPLSVAMVAGPAALWLGYRSLADLLIPGVYGSLAGTLLVWMIYHPFGLLFTLLDTDPVDNSERLRAFLGYQGEERVPGLWLGRLLLVLMLAAALVYWGLFVWQVPQSEVGALGAYLSEGFKVGTLTVVPLKLVMATVVFFLVLTLARWLRNQLSDRWLTRTRLDAGARQSIVALTTYTIVGVAMLSSLSMAGVDFQNLAIVAGALSVGIGFGLQNIVNNFVSGLILLFERPVRPGDWIVVGATEGYVKKISIRSTQIQTFDRADVLVPNSELISSQVTNWMLRDRMGRVVVPVGVAYGSDTAKVGDILTRVAREHPFVLVNSPDVPPPRVLFMGFGASSLDFELRCFVREVDQRLVVRSDLLFAIDKAFREHNIEIPFPQRVVHMAKPPAAGEGDKPKDSQDG